MKDNRTDATIHFWTIARQLPQTRDPIINLCDICGTSQLRFYTLCRTLLM